MNPKKIRAVSEMKAAERYDYFIRKVCDFEMVWGLYDGGWATGVVESKSVIPVWPEEEFAAISCGGTWSGYSPKAIPLGDFKDRWIPGATADGKLFAIFPTQSDKASTVEGSRLLSDIDAESKSYE